MNGDTLTSTPSSPEKPPAPRNWSFLHTAALVLLTAGFVWLAVWHPWGLYTSWLTVMVAIVVFILIAGHGIQGVWRGAFIDNRNMISLSRLQMFTWTVLIISAFGTIAIARALQHPAEALDIAVPPTVWLLMGISTTSLIGSPMIKDSKQKAPTPKDASAVLRRQGLQLKDVRVEGQIVSNTDPRQARWSNLFTSEEVSNVTFLDLAKIQMFFFTVLVVLSYAVAIAASLRGATIPDYLPDVGDGMVTLLGISHAGYLAGKAVPGSGRS